MKLLRLVPLIVALLVSAFAVQSRTSITSAAKPPPATPTPAPLAADQVSVNYASTHGVKSADVGPRGHLNGQGHANFGTAPNVDSVLSFNDHYFVSGFDSNGNPTNEWYTNTLGSQPQQGGTTTFKAPVVPVVVDLLNYDGTQRYCTTSTGTQVPMILDPTQNAHGQTFTPLQNTLASPLFNNASYSSSSTPTQFNDAVQRAEYYQSAQPNWHTLLSPSVKTTRTISLLRGTYRFATYADCSLAYVLVDENTFVNDLFPTVATDTTTPVGAAENAGEVTTQDVSTFLFNNVYLYENGDPNQCCVLGFHSYDFEPGTTFNGNSEKRYVMNYSSWISPGIFGAGFQDVTATSHELAETFNDPFVASNNINNITPWWLAPNGLCQNNLETGDVIEGLSNATYPMTMNGYTYHPQNEALTQWFESGTSSNALDGAYSYPNESILTHANVSQPFNCGQ